MMLTLVFAAVSSAATPCALNAQGLFDKAKDVAKKSSIGQKATKLGTEAQMIDATGVDLEEKNIPPISVGTLQLGISGVDIKNFNAVRLKLYLFNPAQQDASVPVPTPDLFVLVDEKGRRLELLGTPEVKNLTAGAAEIKVPGMERVAMTLLFHGMAGDARLGTLKIGTAGNIAGIPLNTAAAPPGSSTSQPAAASGPASPWKK
jgi:hypothetical protein